MPENFGGRAFRSGLYVCPDPDSDAQIVEDDKKFQPLADHHQEYWGRPIILRTAWPLAASS